MLTLSCIAESTLLLSSTQVSIPRGPRLCRGYGHIQEEKVVG